MMKVMVVRLVCGSQKAKVALYVGLGVTLFVPN